MKTLSKHLTYANLMASFAVFLALGGAAFAVKQAKKNSVTSASIRNGAVTSADVKDESLTIADVGPNAIGAGEVANQSLSGAEIENNSIGSNHINNNDLGGDDIDEASLEAVPLAKQAGVGRYGFNGSCNPESATFEPCSVAEITLDRPGRLLVTGTVEGEPEAGTSRGSGNCRIGTTLGPIGASTIRTEILPEDQVIQRTMTVVTDVFPAGTHSVGVDCNEVNPAIDGIVFGQARVTVVALSDA